MEDGRWKMEDGRWKMEDGRWKMEDGTTILDPRPSIRNALPNLWRCSYPAGYAYTMTTVSDALRIFTACSHY
jgi:hypothetical protein